MSFTNCQVVKSSWNKKYFVNAQKEWEQNTVSKILFQSLGAMSFTNCQATKSGCKKKYFVKVQSECKIK